MLRITWHFPALIAVALCASLIPQISYKAYSGGEPGNDVLVAWPGWAVQQDVGPVGGSVGTFQIWVSAQPGGDVLTMWASLVDASTREVVRQTSFDVRPGYFPASRNLMFPGYTVPIGQRLLLQLQVAEHEHNYVIFRLARPRADLASLMLNGVADAGSGPLAFVHLRTGSGFRAAFAGESSERVRVVLAFTFSMLAFVVHPRVARVARRSVWSGWIWVHAGVNGTWGLIGSGPASDHDDRPTISRRLLSVPWYPWLVGTTPILNFLVSNPSHFVVSESFIPLAVALSVVTASTVGLRVMVGDWHRPAAAVSCVVTVFFAYGHIERVLHDLVNEQLYFAVAVALAVMSIALVVRQRDLITRSTQYLNLAISVLFLFPAVNLVAGAMASCQTPTDVELSSLNGLASHVLPEGIPEADDRRADIYYIVLDRYARHDALGDFDNADFLNELRSRGFYVATQAISNYKDSIHSIPSSLNMSYLNELGDRTPRSRQDLLNLGYWNALAAILKSLGYTYVHLESGYIVTENAPLADVVLTFTPSGVQVRADEATSSSPGAASFDPMTSERFVRHLLATTAAKPILSGVVSSVSDASPYDWWSPHRTLQMFDVLSKPMPYSKPKFVFAHIVKPHLPATFDQYGNQVIGQSFYDSLDDSHDLSVPDAYTGQLIYINQLTLKAIDGILQSSDGNAVIVIASDHGREGSRIESSYQILAAFHMPDSGGSELYPTISSVNHFRYVLRHYFDLDIQLAEDRMVDHGNREYDFTGGEGEVASLQAKTAS